MRKGLPPDDGGSPCLSGPQKGVNVPVFKSQADRGRLVEILKTINPTTVAAYGPALDAWLGLPTDLATLAAVLKLINPQTVAVYGPMLDAWLTGPDRFLLVQIVKTINPVLVSAYGPLLDAWAVSE